MFAVMPALKHWIKIELKPITEGAEVEVWTGFVENVSESGILLSNNQSAAGCGNEQCLVPWSKIAGYKYFAPDELVDYYVGE